MKKIFSKENVSLALLCIGILCILVGALGAYVCMLVTPEYAEINKYVFIPLFSFGFIPFIFSMIVLEW